jgi:predicted deacylase
VNFKSLKNNLSTSFISLQSGGYISANNTVFSKIPNTKISRYVLKESIKGTPMFKFSSNYNEGKRVLIISGIHGNELPPQIASLHLIEKLYNTELNGEVYIIPFSAPLATMNCVRWYNSVDLNRTSGEEGSISNLILKKAIELKIDSIGDFHSSGPNSNPGKEGVFCTKSPCKESCVIGNYISKKVGSEIISFNHAGSEFMGALEDESNLIGIPAVTCEVLSPNSTASKEAINKSLMQMEAYLSYFDIL